MDTTPHTAAKLSEFLKKMVDEFHSGNLQDRLQKDFDDMDKYMKNQPLPVEREEFEDRARLFSLMRSIEEFIKEYGKPYNEETDDYYKAPFASDVSEGKIELKAEIDGLFTVDSKRWRMYDTSG